MIERMCIISGIKWWLPPAIGLLSLLLFFSVNSYGESEAEKRHRLNKLKESIRSLKTELQSVKSHRSELLEGLEESEKNIGELSSKVKKIQQQLNTQERELKELRQQQQQLNEAKNRQQIHVRQHINTAYRLGQESGIRLLLNQQNPEQLARNLKYYDYLLAARAKKIHEYSSTLTELNVIEPQIAHKTATMRSHHESLRKRHRQLQTSKQERQQTLAKLEAIIVDKDKELEKLQQDRGQLEKLLRKVGQLLGDIQLSSRNVEFAQQKGRLPWPTQGKVIHRFGTSRIVGKLRWQGLVIAAREGQAVTAVHHGRVVFADYLRGHGLLLILDHGSGFMSLYAHNQALYREVGEWVDAGQVIATVGSSGGQSRSALYFELRHQGRPANPQKWLAKGFSRTDKTAMLPDIRGIVNDEVV